MAQYIQVAQLELGGYHFMHGLADQLTLIIEPCVYNSDEAPLEYLYKQFEAWLKLREIQYEAHKGSWSIRAEDYGLYDQLKSEAGLHFFYGSFGSPVPVRLRLDRPGATDEMPESERIIRIYDRGNTLIDLRSGFANDYFTTPGEWNLLLFAGWSESTRKLKPGF